MEAEIPWAVLFCCSRSRLSSIGQFGHGLIQLMVES